MPGLIGNLPDDRVVFGVEGAQELKDLLGAPDTLFVGWLRHV
jgi:hypothetical protein